MKQKGKGIGCMWYPIGFTVAANPSAATVKVNDRKVQVKGFPQRNLPISEVALQAQFVQGQPPIGSASFNPPTVDMDPETGQGKPFSTYVYATQIAEVEVDDETGQVDVIYMSAAHDCGTAINPMLVEGQIQGGISMGVGFALQEEMLFDEDGIQINPNLTNYILYGGVNFINSTINLDNIIITQH